LFVGLAVTLLGAPNPSPSNGQSPTTVSDGGDQKLVIESHLGAIGDQANLTHGLALPEAGSWQQGRTIRVPAPLGWPETGSNAEQC
jgi:hypothetical protein